MICSGEALLAELRDRFFERLECELHNLYGPTEAAVDVTHWACQRADRRSFVPIGRPVANTRIYILDSRLRTVPVGVCGELYIGGVQVGRGYLGRPELTAERFMPDPFSGEPGARLYKTGDLARFLNDGSVEYLGRMDHQVKIRGFRIELGEIQTELARHPAVGESVVLARAEDGDEPRLVAYLVGRAGLRATASALREHLLVTLPDHMVPSSFVWLETLPVTPNGKLDLRSLPPPPRRRPELDRPWVAPRNGLERTLCRLLEEVLAIEGVGIHDRFFELGGTSLQATRFVAALGRELGEPIPVVAFFDAPTVAEMAVVLLEEYPSIVAATLGARETAGEGRGARRAGVPKAETEPMPSRSLAWPAASRRLRMWSSSGGTSWLASRHGAR